MKNTKVKTRKKELKELSVASVITNWKLERIEQGSAFFSTINPEVPFHFLNYELLLL